MLDLRTPTGWFFSILGVILVGLGVLDPGRASLTTLNVNLYSGLPMLIFGGVMLFLARART
ncbi:MAG TPA: hypothetical protein VMT32_16000 [Bryobacteraceae bacterium]|nr:hypothetical protein [Bryobacteraceae bacterium]